MLSFFLSSFLKGRTLCFGLILSCLLSLYYGCRTIAVDRAIRPAEAGEEEARKKRTSESNRYCLLAVLVRLLDRLNSI